MTTSLESAIVRIRAAQPEEPVLPGNVVGAGFLMTGRHVLTCAHVVSSALGLAPDMPNPPQVDLHLDFPLLAPESILIARVSHWHPTIDVAVLELTSDPPDESKPALLVTADDLWDHSFRALGFPAGYEQGVWASGVLRGRQAGGWLQVEDTKETGYLIAPGFSGGPVWDDVLGGVVGMVVAADTDEKTKAAFLIPADILTETLPNLAHAYAEWAQAQLDADMDQLRARRDQADEARREMRECQRVVNLRPLDMTHTFKDRVREAQTLCDHLTDSSVRLVSVVGRGGMGKTALVSHVLGDLEQGALPITGEKKALIIDGILYLSARSTGLGLERIYVDVGQMLGEPVASTLNVRWADGSMPLTAKVEYLLKVMQEGLYLILLDNLEDNLTKDGNIAEEGLRLFVERCLTQPSGVRLIVTSREHVKTTAAALHGARSISLREGLPEDEAVALLRDLDPEGTLGLGDAPEDDLRRAAQLTRGIPRALEILAGILYENPTASLPRLLADEKLFGEQVVEQLVAAGYSRLGEAEQRVIEALAVFDRPVEETSVAYLLHPWWPGLDVQAILYRLVRGYFVSVNRATGRYSLHPLDREYAYRQIPDVADKESDLYNRRNLELRVADFYASIRKPESEWKTIDDLEPQLAEFEHRVRGEDYDAAYRVLELIEGDYLYMWGRYSRLIEMREKLTDYLTDPSSRATNLGRLGKVYCNLGQIEYAINLYETALTIVRKIDNQAEISRHLGNLGFAYRDLGQIERAIEFYEKALEVARAIGDKQQEGTHLSRLSYVYYIAGDAKQAAELSEKALTIAREIGDRQKEGARVSYLGRSYRLLGKVEQAISLYKEALTIAREVGNRREEGIQLSRLGDTYSDLGQIKRAIQFQEEALAIFREIGDRWGESVRLGRLGDAYYALGQLKRVIQLNEQALAIACEIGHRLREERHLSNLGNAYCALGQIEQAISFYKKALVIALEVGDHLGESHHLLGLGRALFAVGEFAQVQQYCTKARDLDIRATSYQASLVLGIVLLCQQNLDAAEVFTDAIVRCQVVLDKTPGLYRPHYVLAAALLGQILCDLHWDDTSQRADLLDSVLTEYRHALEITSAPRIVQDAIRDLELIRAAGIEGLEPVFELLESALETAQQVPLE
ncbi:MAG: tetratricopeptide repeat protein [Chloroflexi bacterium]|nr:tetratricopeptide repeat protein [Chloroflexota bacterium]